MNDWHNLHVTDYTGSQFFKTVASPMSTMSEIRNLQNHIETAKMFPLAYGFLDVETAVLMLDGLPYGDASEIDADALLKELGL
jgi:hypothetical protein